MKPRTVKIVISVLIAILSALGTAFTSNDDGPGGLISAPVGASVSAFLSDSEVGTGN